MMQKMNYHEARKCQEKAYLLNPDTLNSYLLLMTWLVDYTQLDKTDIQCAEQLGKLSRFCGKGVTAEVIIGEFAQITQRQLLYEGDEELYDNSYRILISGITDSALLAEISFLYNYERGRILCNNREFMEALPYTQKAFQLKPKNSDAKNNLLYAINNSIETQDFIKRLEQLNQIAEEVPALLEDNLFAQLRLSMYLAMMEISFYDRNAPDGEKYRMEFEVLYPQRISKYQFLEGDVERAYGTASSYYFKTNQLNKSKAILEKGLEYAPNSYELKNRLNALK
jgi:tetratricopeptide (TPR) repeat protein